MTRDDGRRHALLLAYYFPPATGIATERMVGFHRHLPAFGWDSHVVAPRTPHFPRAGERAQAKSEGVVRTSAIEISRLFRRGYKGLAGGGDEPDEASGSVSPVVAGRLGAALRRWVREWLYVPDAQVGWIPFAVRAGTRAVAASGPGPWVVYSSSVPYSAHLAAARLASRFRMPWVAEFRDPWSAQDELRLPASRFRRELDRRMEAWILGACQRVVVTAERTRELLLEEFPEVPPGKVALVPNGFEPLPEGAPPGPDEPMVLLHAGTLQEPGYLRPLLEAAENINRGSGESPAVRIVSVGDPGPWLETLGAMGLGEVGWVELRGIREPAEAAGEMGHATALLLFYPHERFSKVISGKLFSYLGARRPVFGVVPPGSEMDRLIREAGEGWLVPAWETPAVEERLSGLLLRHRQGTVQSPRVPEEVVRPLTREARAGALARLFEEAIAEGGGG